MAAPKNEAFLRPEVQLSAYCKALAHPARIAILKLLAEHGTCTCGAIVEELPLAQATVSQHLRALRAAGLIRVRAEGPRSCYTLDPEGLQAFQRAARFLFVQIEPSPRIPGENRL
ncbi:MAG: ArsR family transcriptional regulator [Bacteroidetes bacterium]|nr:transcriptional regulator [Rhodothermaceae bacterium RA]RMH49604.1 MAG: ArsR family transcriptional regulator [Bacteroidota bacterium]